MLVARPSGHWRPALQGGCVRAPAHGAGAPPQAVVLGLRGRRCLEFHAGWRWVKGVVTAAVNGGPSYER